MRERFTKEAFTEYATDGKHVGGEEGKEREGHDDVEAESGAEVDEAESAGSDGC